MKSSGLALALLAVLGCTSVDRELRPELAATLRPSIRALGVPKCPAVSERQGEATYYTFAHRMGNCSLEPAAGGALVGALNTREYARSAACGACVRITGPKGAITVRIVDRCPRCGRGDIDLSRAAFERIAERRQGRVAIRWKFVPCAVSGPIRYHFERTRERGWTALQIRNHRHAVAKVEWLAEGGRAVPLLRRNDNYFVAAAGIGKGPHVLRVTDVHGSSVMDREVSALSAAEVPGAAQFPACRP
ncbi:MAG TPA: expansin EXLX1 family cellulose-binding protein [Polyangiaceae bacterium]|nr:expansin EXLX1 family cellulose-binding protein [Polyangiaceae bacterium]